MNVPYRELKVRDQELKEKLLRAVGNVLDSGRLMLGPEVQELEKKVADISTKKHAIGVSSGTMALHLALRGLDIGPGDEVITTPFSWIATLNAIVLTGAKPVFVDIRNDFNIDPYLIEDSINARTRCILPVHLMGKICDMEMICDIAKRYGLYVIEDAAQAFGARLETGPAGSFGQAGCFSMNPMKILSSFGEAGMIVTDDDILYDRLKRLRYLGTSGKGDCDIPSLNGKIGTIQAAMLLVNLTYLEKRIQRGCEIAKFYTQKLKDLVSCPEERGPEHIYLSYTVLSSERDALMKFLHSKGVDAKIHYQALMPNNSAYRRKYTFHAPVAQKMADQLLSLPNQDYTTLEDAAYVVDCVKTFFSNKKPSM